MRVWEGGDLGRDAGHVGLDERRQDEDHSNSDVDDRATNVDLLLRPLAQLPGLVILQFAVIASSCSLLSS